MRDDQTVDVYRLDTEKPIIWNDTLKVGYPVVDSHHKKLFSITKRLYDLLYSQTSADDSKVEKIAVELRNYAVYHFAAEEEIMQKHNCPFYSEHKKEHEIFVQKIEEPFSKLVHGSIAARKEVYRFLVNWLVKHVTQADKCWATWIHENS